MKNNYITVVSASNAVQKAAPASVWGNVIPGKGGKTTNAAISAKGNGKKGAGNDKE